MFAKADIVDAGLIGENGLLHHVADHLIVGLLTAVIAQRDVAKGVECEFQGHHGLKHGVGAYEGPAREKKRRGAAQLPCRPRQSGARREKRPGAGMVQAEAVAPADRIRPRCSAPPSTAPMTQP